MTVQDMIAGPAAPLRRWLWLVAAVVLVLATLWLPPALRDVPPAFVLPLTDRVGAGLDWFAREAHLGPVAVQDITRALAAFVNAPIEGLSMVLAEGYERGAGFNRERVLPPLSWAGIIAAVALLGWRLSGPGLAALIVVSGLYLVSFGLWTSAMITLSSVLVCVVLALGLGLAIGVLSYRSARAEAVARGMMNVMQTVPIFSYLIPTLLLFGYGPSAALFATVVYALPPMVHATVLALRAVPAETRELAAMTGCTKRQTLWKVELPVALPQLAIGLNQVVMMTLNMVIIASMIGAGGLGFDVLRALRRLDIGAGLQAGLGIVVIAVVLDRLTQAAASAQSRGQGGKVRRRDLWAMAALVLGATAVSFAWPVLTDWPAGWTLTTAPFWNDLVSWINRNWFDALDAFRTFALLEVMNPLRDLLLAIPYAVVIAGAGAAGAALGGARLCALCAGLLAFIAVAGYWGAAMTSLYLILIAVGIALALGVPLGIWLSRRPRLREPATLMLDALQTMPTLVYLLPAVMLFRNGDVAALIAVTSYAIAPAIRYGMDAMRHVPPERLEAARMCGCTPGQVLTRIELPAAFPTLLLGVNQTIMMALSMLVIAALVGTRELGQEVYTALSQGKTGEGMVAGLCVAALALTLDGLLKAASARTETRMGQGHA